MRKIFKKVSAIAASALMIGATMGIAAAANYPNPFVVGGSADVAVVYGTGSGVSSLDLVQAGNIQSNLQSYMTGGTTGAGTTITGEAAALFGSGSSQIFINSSLNSVKSGSLTKTNLPMVLADTTISGNVDATITQAITLGSDPTITFAKQPTSEDDPSLGLTLSTTSGKYLYNATATFNKAVNFTHADTQGEEIELFGTKWTVSSATDTTDLVLLRSAEKITLSSDDPTAQVTINGETYAVELISASDSAATVAVTNSAGETESKEINEAQSKTVNGISIAVTTADETNLKLSATIVAGDEEGKITLADGSAVTKGTEGTVIDGTIVGITGGTTAATKLTVSIYAPEADSDALLSGQSFVDPVFGTFKMDFPGFNIEADGASREEVKLSPSGDDKMLITMTDYRGYDKTFQYVYNGTDGSGMVLHQDTNGHKIVVSERTPVNYSDYVILGNEDDARLVKLSSLTNQSTGYSSDKVVFTDVFSGETYDASLTSDGGGTVTIGGNDYTIAYNFSSTLASEARTVQIQSPDSTGTGAMIIYPTISTSKGAKVMFYKPMVINVTSWDTSTDEGQPAAGVASNGNALTSIEIPNGANAYQSITIGSCGGENQSFAGQCANTSAGGFTVVNITNTGLSFNFTWNAANQTKVYLTGPSGNTNVVDPAIVILEEKDDSNSYEAVIITTEPGDTSTDGIGVNDVLRTWTDDATWNAVSLYSDSDKTQETDRWGTIVTLDSSDSDQKVATVSYPDSQIYAQLYLAEEAASITSTSGGTTSGTQLGDVLVKDSEVSSVSSKNLIVVGGSCINSVAASLIGQPACGEDFTTQTGIGSGQFLIQSFGASEQSVTSKIALLVAGYDAADTVKAATYLRTQTVSTDAGSKYKGSTSTSAELVVE